MLAAAGAAADPPTVFSVVDLPAPFAPISVTISPSIDLEGDALDGMNAAVIDVNVFNLQHDSSLTASFCLPR